MFFCAVFLSFVKRTRLIIHTYTVTFETEESRERYDK